MSESDSNNWGFFRRPALFGPIVGFFAFLAADAIRAPSAGGGDGIAGWIFLIPVLMIVILFSAIPYLAGAFILLATCRKLPNGLVRLTLFRMILGGLVGALISWPFAHALNWIPSATTTEPRFNFVSLLIACAVGGGYCALFYSEAPSAERAREGAGDRA